MAKIKHSKIEISLTDFVDFVCKSGSAKMTKVKQVKERDDYSPATDFYKGMREGIIENHESNGDKKGLKPILERIKDGKKVNHYEAAVKGYEKFWGRKTMKWFNPPNTRWLIGDLDIKVNPELGLEIDDEFYIVKLYLKSDKLSKDRISQVLTLMENQLRKLTEVEMKMAVLDVKNSKLHVYVPSSPSLMPLLEGEAKSFETIWKAI